MLEIIRAGPGYPRFAALLTLIHRAFAPQRGLLDPPSSAFGETAETLQAHAARGGCLLCERGGLPLACLFFEVQAGETGSDLYLYKLAVDPAFQGQGLARRLILAAEAEAAERGLLRLTASARKALGENQAFFAHLGFEKVGEGRHAGFKEPTYWKLARPLPGPCGSQACRDQSDRTESPA